MQRTRQALEHPIVQGTGNRFRKHVREMWESRGGGFYGFVAVLTFLYLETIDLAGDVAGGFQLELGWLISFFVSNAVDFALNMMWSAIWPLTWVTRFGINLQSAALLGGAYVGYRALRPTVLRLLQDPAGPNPPLPLEDRTDDRPLTAD
jgi:hypothetical protein